MTRIRISLLKSLEKVILHILKISTKFGVAPQSFCENQNSVQDQDHDFTLDFNTRPTFHTLKTPTKFCSDPLTPSKVIVSTSKVPVRTDRQTEIFWCLFCLLRHTKHEHSSKGEIFFLSCDCNTGCVQKIMGIFVFYFLITYRVCKKRKYCNRMSEKKNSLLLTNVYDFYVLEDKTSQKKFPSVCLSGCMYVRGLFMWTQCF